MRTISRESRHTLFSGLLDATNEQKDSKHGFVDNGSQKQQIHKHMAYMAPVPPCKNKDRGNDRQADKQPGLAYSRHGSCSFLYLEGCRNLFKACTSIWRIRSLITLKQRRSCLARCFTPFQGLKNRGDYPAAIGHSSYSPRPAYLLSHCCKKSGKGRTALQTKTSPGSIETSP